MDNYYSILDIPETATPEEIKQAYRQLVQIWHPDNWQHKPKLLAKAEQKTKELNAAFDTLSNPLLKQRYDEELRSRRVRLEQRKSKDPGDEVRTTRCPNPACESVLRVNAKTVGVVTCPSCQTTFRYDPERNEKWDVKFPDWHLATEKSEEKSSHHHKQTSHTTPQEREFLTLERMAGLGMVLVLVVVAVLKNISGEHAKSYVSENFPTVAPGASSAQRHEPSPIDSPATRNASPAGAPPRLEEFLEVARPANPNFNDLEIAMEYRKLYPDANKFYPPPPMEAWLVAAKEANPQFNEAELKSAYTDIYGAPKESPTADEQFPFKEQGRVRHDAGVRDTAEVQKRHLNRHEAMQRQTEQVPRPAPTTSTGSPSVPDLQKLKTQSAQGLASAQFNLGMLYANGRGVPQDYTMARNWWEKSAAQGHAKAQAQLGVLYANGWGVPQDYAQARQWYENAAAQGNAWAEAQLAVLYANGQGVPQDHTTARQWWEKAALHGNAEAQTRLGMMYAYGPADYARARLWWEKAALQGDAGAQNHLGQLYEGGLGVSQNDVLAYMWFSLAGANGDKYAAQHRDALANKLTPTQIAEARELAQEQKPKTR
jgi:TPR repeat protein